MEIIFHFKPDIIFPVVEIVCDQALSERKTTLLRSFMLAVFLPNVPVQIIDLLGMLAGLDSFVRSEEFMEDHFTDISPNTEQYVFLRKAWRLQEVQKNYRLLTTILLDLMLSNTMHFSSPVALLATRFLKLVVDDNLQACFCRSDKPYFKPLIESSDTVCPYEVSVYMCNLTLPDARLSANFKKCASRND